MFKILTISEMISQLRHQLYLKLVNLEPDISQHFSISSLFSNPHSFTLLQASTPLGGPLQCKYNVLLLHFNMRETYYAMSTNTILPLPPSQITGPLYAFPHYGTGPGLLRDRRES
jgi:hypothetical protein